MSIKGIPVSEILRKSEDPMEEPKLAVVRGVRSFEDEGSNWAVDQIIHRVRQLIPEVQIADIHLGSYKILTGVSNDPEDTLFSPNDQFPLVRDLLERSDGVLWATREHFSFPDSNTVKLFERYGDLISSIKD